MVSAALPVLVSMAVCAALVVLVTEVKVSEDGVRETSGAGAVVPVPMRETVCGEPVALSAKTTLDVRLPVVVGVKVTTTLQFAPPASDAPQVPPVPG